MAANMNSEMQDTTRLVVLLDECRQMGIEVAFPDINRSDAAFKAEGGKIVYGLGGIKNVGLSTVERLVAERRKKGPYLSLFDLCRRLDGQHLNRRAMESLILAGALPDSIPGNRAQQFAAVENAMEWAQGHQLDHERGQVSLFEGGAAATATGVEEPGLPAVDPWPYPEMLEKEKEVLGFYLSGHPLEPFRAELEGFATCPLDPEKLKALPSGSQVVLGGMITRLKQGIGKDNRTYAFAQLEDFVGKVEVVLWADVYESVRHLVALDSMVLIRGALEWDEERGKHKISSPKRDRNAPRKGSEMKVMPLSEARTRLTKSVHVRFKTGGLPREQLERMQSLCEMNPGHCRLVFHVQTTWPDPLAMLSEKYQVSPAAGFFDGARDVAGAGNVWLSARAE